jgi:hypothetical protein
MRESEASMSTKGKELGADIISTVMKKKTEAELSQQWSAKCEKVREPKNRRLTWIDLDGPVSVLTFKARERYPRTDDSKFQCLATSSGTCLKYHYSRG